MLAWGTPETAWAAAEAMQTEAAFRPFVSSITEVVHFGHYPWDHTAPNQLVAHPVYGWMGWVAVLNPSAATLARCLPLLDLAHAKAVQAFEKRLKN